MPCRGRTYPATPKNDRKCRNESLKVSKGGVQLCTKRGFLYSWLLKRPTLSVHQPPKIQCELNLTIWELVVKWGFWWCINLGV